MKYAYPLIPERPPPVYEKKHCGKSGEVQTMILSRSQLEEIEAAVTDENGVTHTFPSRENQVVLDKSFIQPGEIKTPLHPRP